MSKPTVIRKRPPNPPPLRRLSIRARRWWSGILQRRRKRAWRKTHPRPVGKTVCFVLGCQRSGTNMLIRTLDRMMEVDRFDEDDSRAFVGNRIRGKEVRARLIAKSNAACIIFKPICDSHRALELLCDHPGAKVIWIYRRFSDVAASAVQYWGELSRLFITDLLAGGGAWNQFQWNREGVTEESLAPIRAAIPTPLSDIDAACIFWHLRNALFFAQGLQNRPDVQLIRYETLVADAPTGFANLCSFMDLAFDPAAVARVHKESVGKGAQHPIAPEVYTLCEGLLRRLDAAAEAHHGRNVVTAK